MRGLKRLGTSPEGARIVASAAFPASAGWQADTSQAAVAYTSYFFDSRLETARLLMANKGNRSGSSALVYSTETGRMCPICQQAIAACTCRSAKNGPATDGIVRVSLETKGRRGKGVTVIKGVPLDAIALTELGKQLKAACGSGGTVKDGIIEIQGDHREALIPKLALRWVVKRAGG